MRDRITPRIRRRLRARVIGLGCALVLLAGGRTAAAQSPATIPVGPARLKLLVLGPFDGDRRYGTSSNAFQIMFASGVVPKVTDKFQVVFGNAAENPLKALPEAKGLSFDSYYEFHLFSDDNYALPRKFGRVHGADFVALLARDKEHGYFYLTLIDVENERGVYEGKGSRKNLTQLVFSEFKRMVAQAEPAMARALSRKGSALARARGGGTAPGEAAASGRAAGGGGEPADLERLRKQAAMLKAEAEARAEQARREWAALEAKIRDVERRRNASESERERAFREERKRLAKRLEEERLDRERERAAREEAERKRLDEIVRMRPAAIFLSSPKEGTLVETETVRLGVAVASQVDIATFEVLLNDAPAALPGGGTLSLAPKGGAGSWIFPASFEQKWAKTF